MKKRCAILSFLIIWAFASLACNLSLIPESAPTGLFACDAIENGAFTTHPVFQIMNGGRLLDLQTGTEGKWQYDAEKKVFTFNGDVSLLRAKFKKGNDSWLVDIQPQYMAGYITGKFTNSDQGKLRCYRSEAGH